MKRKRIFFASVAILAIAFIGTFAVSSRRQTTNEALYINNVEALSRTDAGGLVVQCKCKSHFFSPNVCTVNSDGGYCGGDPCANHDSNCR